MPTYYVMTSYEATNVGAPPASPNPVGTTGAIKYGRTHHNVTILFENAGVPADPIVAATIELYGWLNKDMEPVCISTFTVNSSTTVSRCAIPLPVEVAPYEWLYVRQTGGTDVKYMIISSSNASA